MIGTDTQINIAVATINMGRSRSSHFPIIKTVTGVVLTVNQPVNCINPKTQQITTGIVTKWFWTIDWDDVPEWAEGLMFWGWGIGSKALRTALIAHDPAFTDQWAIIVLIKETIS